MDIYDYYSNVVIEDALSYAAHWIDEKYDGEHILNWMMVEEIFDEICEKGAATKDKMPPVGLEITLLTRAPKVMKVLGDFLAEENEEGRFFSVLGDSRSARWERVQYVDEMIRTAFLFAMRDKFEEGVYDYCTTIGFTHGEC